MNAYPFSIFKRADRSCYSVSFKDANGKYLRPISTGKKTEKEAMEVAFKWLRDGIPQKNAALKVNDLSLKNVAREIKSEVIPQFKNFNKKDVIEQSDKEIINDIIKYTFPNFF
jgi:hypothetical protein